LRGRELQAVEALRFCQIILAALVATIFAALVPAHATTFTTTVPGTAIVIPAAYPQAGGVVIVLEGANGNVYYQYSNPSSMFVGYQNTGAPAAWRGNPFQIAPTTNIQCGLQTCAQYFGGSIVRMSVRFTAYDGDARTGQFDFNDLTVRINGTDVGSMTTVPTQTTDTAGTTLVASGTGYGNNTFDTGWFQSTNSALLSNVLTAGTLTSSVYDRDPNDNYWDFSQGANLSQTALEIVAPGVTLDKTANPTSYTAVGNTITYTYALRNIGTVAINNLAVADDKVSSATISCAPSGGTIAVGSTVTCTGTYTITQADIDAGAVTNIATARGTPAFGSLGPLTDTATVTGPLANPSFTFSKTVSPPSIGSVGSTLSYSFQLRNTGNVTLSSLSISDPQLPGLACSVSPIAPGQTGTATCTNNTRTVTQAIIDAGSLTNTASATLRTPSGAAVGPQSASATANSPVFAGSIALTKTASPSPFGAVGSTVSYGFSVRNNTNRTLSSLAVSDPALPGLTCSFAPIAPAATGTAVCSGNTKVVTQADINAGQIVNNAAVTGSAAGTPVSANTSLTTLGPTRTPALTIAKASSTASFDAVNDPVQYTYTVTNSGNVTITSPVTVTDNKIVSPNTVSCNALPVGGLAPGASITCSATYLATQADIDAGGVTNSATARTGTTTSAADTVTVPSVRQPAMTVAKSTVGPVVFDEGSVVTYQYVITNTGNTTLASPTVTDDKIATVNCPAGNLAPGGPPKTCTASYTLTFADVDTIGSVTNNAIARSGTVQSPPDAVTIPVGAQPTLSLAKSASPTTFSTVGQVITYTFQVTNKGSATFTRAVTIVDPKIGNFTCFTPTAGNTFAPDDVETCQRTYTITQSDLDNGQVVNSAKASTTLGPSGAPLLSPSAEATITADSATQAGALTTTKTVSPTSGATVGSTLTYAIRAQNTGAVTLSNIVITDPKFPSLSCTIGTLAPNAISAANACTATYTVTQADINSGSVSNTATATGTNPKGGAVSDDSPPAISAFSQNSSVTIAKAVASNADGDRSGTISLNDTLTYQVTVRNDGNVTQTNVVVSDPKLSPNTRTCATVAPGATCVLSGLYTVTQNDVDAGTISNQANVTTALLPTPETVSLSTAVPRVPRIALEKTVGSLNLGGDGRLNAGDTVTYNFRVQNTGNVTLTGVTVKDMVPTAPVSGGPISLTPGQVDTTTFTAVYTLTQVDIDRGSVSNTAKAEGTSPSGVVAVDQSDDPSNPAGANDPTVLPLQQQSSISIVKALSNPPSPIVLNSVLTYAVTVTNDGTITQTNVVVSDAKLTPPSRTCATVTPGGTCILSGTYTVTQADVDSGRISNTASAVTSAIPTPETSSLTTDVQQAFGLSLEKRSTATSFGAVGDQVSYSYIVTNSGTVTLRSVVSVTDDKIVAPRKVVCPPLPAAGVPPGGSTTCTATYVVTQADIDNGSVTNTASASSSVSAGNVVTSGPDSVTVPAAQNPGLSVSKSSTTASFDAVGDTVSYTYLVRNTGNVTLTAPVAVADNKIVAPNTVNCPALPPGGLSPNATLTCTATYSASQTDIDAGSVVNTATATSGTTSSAPDTVTVPSIKKPALTVTKQTVGPVNFLLNATVNYQYIVTNTGNTTLPAPSVQDNRISSVSCPSGDIAPSNSITCTASYVVTADDIDIGSVTNNAVAVSGSTRSPPASVTIPQGADPALSLQKSASPVGFDELNELITYTFRVKNTGNVQFTRPININDPLIGTFNCVTPVPGNVFDINETATCTRTYRVTQADLDRGFLRNDASAETTYGASNLPIASPSATATINATVVSQAPQLAVTKTVSPASGAKVGDTLTFQISARNTGKVTISNVVIDDPKLPALSCSIGTLAPGAASAPTSCSDTYVLTQADVDGGSFTNTASARGVAPGGAPVGGQDSVTATAAAAAPKLRLEKTSTSTAYQAVGEPVLYKFKVTNTGNVSLSNIRVTDALVPSYTCVIAALEPGQADDFTCELTYNVTQADINAGEIENTASVVAKPARKANPNDPNPRSEDSIVIPGPDRQPSLTLVKRAGVISTDGGPVKAGDRLVYIFSVTNTGNVTLRDISIDDNKVDVKGGPIRRLNPGQVDDTTLTATYRITQQDIDRGRVVNSAKARGSSPTGDVSDVSDSGTGDGNDPTVTDLSRVPSLAVVKKMTKNTDEDGSGGVSVGDTLNYEIAARNTGNTTLTNVVITDNRINPATTLCLSLAPGEVCNLAGTYKVLVRDVGQKTIVNTASVTADEFPTAIAGVAATAVNDAVSNKQFSKTALKSNIRRGERVPYVIELNRVPLATMRVVDLMPAGFNYVGGSARVNGVAVTPGVKGRQLVFNNLVRPADQRIKIEIILAASGSLSSGTVVNVAQLINPATGVVLATARAPVNIAPEHVFDCSDIIGKVFDDKNRNAYQDEGEPGLPAVRVATVKGLLVTTDPFGRFHVPCGEIPDKDIGSNFIMKVDPRTLPTGYRLTTENPRTIRVTRGKVSELNFGATIGRVVKLDLNGKVFKPGSSSLSDKYTSGIEKLLGILDEEPSILRVQYYLGSDSEELAQQRVSAVVDLLEKRWARRNRQELPVETRIVAESGAPSK
jgi:large repetitive protein